MKTIRHGVFETNSSSTHSLTIMTQEEYDKWDKEHYLADDKIITRDEAIAEIMKSSWNKDLDLNDEEAVEEALKDSEYYNSLGYEDYVGDMEEFSQNFTTPSGDKMVAFGYSGYDG